MTFRRGKSVREYKTKVCVCDNIDQGITVGNDVVFMSQDDC